MSQTFPNDFKISNIDNGTESGTWGTITNSNFNNLVSSVGGFKQISISSTNSHTLTAPADNTSTQDFRNHFLELTGTSTGTAAATFTLTLPASLDKEYVIKNSLQHTINVKTSTQVTPLEIPVGKTNAIYLNGATALPTISTLDSLTLSTALPVSSGGTGLVSAEAGGVMVMNSAGTAFTIASAGPTGNVLTSDGDKFISSSFQSAALSNVVRTNVGGYAAAGNTQPTVANGGMQSIQSYLLSQDTTYIGFDAVGAFNAARRETGITATQNDSANVNQCNLHVFKSGEPNNAITPLAVRNDGGNADVLVTTSVVPFVDNTNDLGSSSKRFNDVFAANGVTTSSDRRLKNSITDSELGLDFINQLQPRRYKVNQGGGYITGVDDTPNYMPTYGVTAGVRFHHGLIAQEVEQTLYNQNIDKSTFAGWCLTDPGDSNSTQMLRYEEFIAPMMKAIQELSNKVNALEARIQQLESN